MKKIVYGCMIGLSLSSLMSCKKDKDPEENGPSYAAKADDAGARTELDKAYDDIEAVYNSQDYESSSTMRTQAVVLPCGNVSFNKDSFKIVYGGINCGSRMLSGSIDVSLISGDKFSDPDAKLKVVFKDYKVYYNASKQSIVYNGTAYVINGPNGGTLISLFTTAPKTVVHKVRGKLELKFDTLGSSILVREWNLFRKKTYTSDGTKTGITLKVEGDTILDADSYIPGTYTNVSEYGVGRDNYKFVSMLVIPFKWENCGTDYAGPYILKQGQVRYIANVKNGNQWLTSQGITWANWSAVAGYKYNSFGAYSFDGGCSSNAYKLEVDLNKADGSTYYSTTSYQPY